MAYTTMVSCMAGCLYILQVINALCQKEVWSHQTRFFVYMEDTVEDHELLDAPMHVYVRAVIMHEEKNIMMVNLFIVRVDKLQFYTCKGCTKCCSQEVFSSWFVHL